MNRASRRVLSSKMNRRTRRVYGASGDDIFARVSQGCNELLGIAEKIADGFLTNPDFKHSGNVLFDYHWLDDVYDERLDDHEVYYEDFCNNVIEQINEYANSKGCEIEDVNNYRYDNLAVCSDAIGSAFYDYDWGNRDQLIDSIIIYIIVDLDANTTARLYFETYEHGFTGFASDPEHYLREDFGDKDAAYIASEIIDEIDILKRWLRGEDRDARNIADVLAVIKDYNADSALKEYVDNLEESGYLSE